MTAKFEINVLRVDARNTRKLAAMTEDPAGRLQLERIADGYDEQRTALETSRDEAAAKAALPAPPVMLELMETDDDLAEVPSQSHAVV